MEHCFFVYTKDDTKVAPRFGVQGVTTSYTKKLPYTFGVSKEFFGVDLMSSLVCFGMHFCQSQRWHRFRHGHFCQQQMCAFLQQRCAFLSAAVCISVSGVHFCQQWCAFLSAALAWALASAAASALQSVHTKSRHAFLV